MGSVRIYMITVIYIKEPEMNKKNVYLKFNTNKPNEEHQTKE